MPAAEQTATFEDVAEAAERISVLARRTPVYTSRLFDQAAGARTYFKCENLQRGGSFKIRGATNFIQSVSDTEKKRGVVTYSSGNHAQAVAIAAAHAGVSATIVMPADAPKAKLESTQAYGPNIVFYDRQTESREAIARQITAETGAVVLPPYDHPWVIAGQGTAALELLSEQPKLDALLVPLGGGGLLSGTLLVAKALNPEIAVYGVEPELADDWRRSLQAGHPVEIPPPPTVADGLRTPVPGNVTFPIVSSLASGVVVVSEEEIKDTVRFLLSRMKLVTEPSGAVAAAAVLKRKLPAEYKRIGVILSGGNVDMDVLAQICGAAA